MRLLSNAPRKTAHAARKAYVYYLEGIRRLKEYAETERPQGTKLWDWMQLRHDAAADLRDCVESLESGVIEIELLNEETLLNRRRKAEEPIQQFAEAVVAHIQEEKRREEEEHSASNQPRQTRQSRSLFQAILEWWRKQ